MQVFRFMHSFFWLSLGCGSLEIISFFKPSAQSLKFHTSFSLRLVQCIRREKKHTQKPTGNLLIFLGSDQTIHDIIICPTVGCIDAIFKQLFHLYIGWQHITNSAIEHKEVT